MEIGSPEILALRRKVRAADEEFHIALAFHEAWKPAATDTALHERIGRSYAANTFNVIRAALRREMLLALMRLWDSRRETVQLVSIANALGDNRILDAMEAECAAQWQGLHLSGLEETPDVVAAARRSERSFGQEQGKILRQRARDAIAIIRKYDRDGPNHATLKYLKRLRNEQLAHRQVDQTPVEPNDQTTSDNEIEAFYQDMSKLVGLLKGVVEQTSYNPADTARIHCRYAHLFWAGVRGERTLGHPNYRPPH